MITSVSVMQPWRIRKYRSYWCKWSWWYSLNAQSITKQCAYSLQHTVLLHKAQHNCYRIYRFTSNSQASHLQPSPGLLHVYWYPVIQLSLWDSFSSLWPSDAIRRHRMACCLTASSHYLNQCWLIINEVLRNSSEGNFSENT